MTATNLKGGHPPVQTYSRKAERLGQRIAKPQSDPRLVIEAAEAVLSQAGEISDYMVQKSGREWRIRYKKSV